MTGMQALAERLRAQHIEQRTWDSGNPEAVDGWVTWCAQCKARPFPCDVARLLADGSVYLTPAEAARVAAIEEAARQLLTYSGPVRVTTEAHTGCEADECYVTALREALEIKP
jgi:hypothetical protein